MGSTGVAGLAPAVTTISLGLVCPTVCCCKLASWLGLLTSVGATSELRAPKSPPGFPATTISLGSGKSFAYWFCSAVTAGFASVIGRYTSGALGARIGLGLGRAPVTTISSRAACSSACRAACSCAAISRAICGVSPARADAPIPPKRPPAPARFAPGVPATVIGVTPDTRLGSDTGALGCALAAKFPATPPMVDPTPARAEGAFTTISPNAPNPLPAALAARSLTGALALGPAPSLPSSEPMA